MSFGVAEERIAGTAERKEAHRCRDSDIDAHHAWLDAILELTGGGTVAGIYTGGIGKAASVDQVDDFIQIFGANHTDHRAENFFSGDGHVGCDAIKQGRPQEKSIRILV